MVAASVLAALFWTMLALSLVTMGFWVFEQYLGWVRYEPPEIEHPPSAVQARILTVGETPDVVQQTVAALPDAVSDVVALSEDQQGELYVSTYDFQNQTDSVYKLAAP